MVGKVVTLTLALAGAHVASPASRNGCPPAGPFTCSTVRQLPQLTGSLATMIWLPWNGGTTDGASDNFRA